MHLSARKSVVLITAAIFPVFGALDIVRGDNVSEANGPGQKPSGAAPAPAKVVRRSPAKQSSGKEVEVKVVEQPPIKKTEPWKITVGVPGWLASTSGTSGFHGVNSDFDVGFHQVLPRLNLVLSFGGEVRNGRFGVLGDLLYLNGQAGVSGSGLVGRLGLGLQQFLGESFGSWRVIEGPRGWLDVLAGFRAYYVGEQLSLNPNVPQVEAASTDLVDRFAQQLATRVSDVRTLIQQAIVDKLTSLKENHPPLPQGPLAGRLKDEIAALIQDELQSRQGELAAAIRTGVQSRVNQLKSQLESQISNTLITQLNRNFSFYDDWFDPVIGLRGRFNLTKAFYVTGESDVGGFGIGSDISVQEYAALGCQVTRYIHTEIGYRFLYDEFRDKESANFLYKVSLYGPQITTGISF
jgi:hypothetical protein